MSEKLRGLGFVAMCMVVVIHGVTISAVGGPEHAPVVVSFVQLFLSDGIARAAVPVFFCISGVLLVWRMPDPGAVNWLQTIMRRVKRLAVPLLVWAGGWALTARLLRFAGYKLFNVDMSWIPVPDGSVFNEVVFSRTVYQFWFVRDLIILTLLAPVLEWCARRIGPWVLLCPSFLYFVTWHIGPVTTLGLFAYWTGICLGLHFQREQNIESRFNLWLVACAWLAVILVKTWSQLELGGEASSLLYAAAPLVGVPVLWSGYDRLPASIRVWAEQLGAYSFFLFAAHEPLITVVKKSALFLTGTGGWALTGVYLGAVPLTIIICLLAGRYIKSLFPSLYGLLTGWR